MIYVFERILRGLYCVLSVLSMNREILVEEIQDEYLLFHIDIFHTYKSRSFKLSA